MEKGGIMSSYGDKPCFIFQAKGAGTTAGKRQGDTLQDPSQKRRAAFGDITNVIHEIGKFTFK